MMRESGSWTRQQVRAEQAAIKDELDQQAPKERPIQRASYIQKRLDCLLPHHDSRSRLKCYIYIVSSLALFLRHPHMFPSHARRALHLAFTLLRHQGIKMRESRLSCLYADLFTIASQTEHSMGENFQAAWTSEMSIGCHHQPWRQQQLFANRLLRLGHGSWALRLFDACIEHTQGVERQLIHLWRLRLLRLMAAPLRFHYELANCSNLFPEIGPLADELAWEQLCVGGGPPQQIVESALADPRFQGPGYQLEAYLWALACKEKRLIHQARALQIPSKNAMEGCSIYKPLRKAVTVLISCYDYRRPLWWRKRRLGQILAQSRVLPHIDKELLVWAAAARFLTRSKAYSLASLCLAEYNALALKLTADSPHKDPLNLVTDLHQTPALKPFLLSPPSPL